MNETRDTSCADVAAMLPALVDDHPAGDASPGAMPLAMRRHLSRCPHCAGELESYWSLKTATAGLLTATASPPAGLRESLVAIPSGLSRLDEVKSHVARHRRAYAGGVAVALGATGAALWRSRRRGMATA